MGKPLQADVLMGWLFPGPHSCVAVGCRQIIGARYLACDAHWVIIPPALRAIYFQMRHDGRPRDGFDEVCENIVAQIQEATSG